MTPKLKVSVTDPISITLVMDLARVTVVEAAGALAPVGRAILLSSATEA